jgi:hypothetical protein
VSGITSVGLNAVALVNTRIALLGLGALMLVGTVVWLAMLPVQLTT